jgi:hypothetical protein
MIDNREAACAAVSAGEPDGVVVALVNDPCASWRRERTVVSGWIWVGSMPKIVRELLTISSWWAMMVGSFLLPKVATQTCIRASEARARASRAFECAHVGLLFLLLRPHGAVGKHERAHRVLIDLVEGLHHLNRA